MIEQQYYTRERGGLFTQTDGYDTIAKSPMLKLDYIKKNIHPICHYDAPSELVKASEADEGKYPPNFMIVPMPDDELLVGQSVYKNKDFTGQRSTFFMHNFLLSEKEKRRYVKEPEKLFGINGFITGFDTSQGNELPTLAAIPYERNPLFEDREQLLKTLGMDEETFKQLIAATFLAVSSRKKIFIVLNVEIQSLGIFAKALLYHLYMAMPWRVIEKMGVCTYAATCEPRKNIQITFLDCHTLRHDSPIGKEFIFDMVNHKVLNLPADVTNAIYLDMVFKYNSNKVVWEKYNGLVDELAKAQDMPGVYDIDFYGECLLFFEMSLYLRSHRIYDLSNDQIRKNLLKQLLKAYKSDIPDDLKKMFGELIEYTIVLFHEDIKKGKLLSKDELNALFEFKLKIGKGDKNQFMHLQQMILLLLGEAKKLSELPGGDVRYIDQIFDMARQYPDFNHSLYEVLYKQADLKEQIVYPRLAISLNGKTELHLLQESVESWQGLEDILLSDPYYKELVRRAFESAFKVSGDKVKLLKSMRTWCGKHEGSLYRELIGLVESYFLTNVNLAKDIPSEKVLCELTFSHSYLIDNYETIMAYQALKNDISLMSPSRIRVNNKVQQLIKIFYKSNAQKEDFYLLVYAFLEPEKNHDGSGKYMVNLKKVLSFLRDIDRKLMLSFIVWSKGQDAYLDKRKFDEQVIHYFLWLKEKKEKVPKEEIRQGLGTSPKTRLLAEKIIRAQQPAIIRTLKRYHKAVTALAVVIILGGGIAAGSHYIQNKNKVAAATTPGSGELPATNFPAGKSHDIDPELEKVLRPETGWTKALDEQVEKDLQEKSQEQEGEVGQASEDTN